MGEFCQSCGRRAAVRLSDGSTWCRPCSRDAVELGYGIERTDHEKAAEDYLARQRANRQRFTERHRSPSLYPGTSNNYWRAEAACRGMHPMVFFPADSMGVPAELAELCRSCPVRQPCLDAAIANNELGIWAGTTRPQRDRIGEASA